MRKGVWAMVLGAGLVSTPAWSDDDDHEGHGERGRSRAAVAPDPTYVKECGACHVAYPAQLLPAASWVRLMGGLDNHFGDDATLAPEVNATLTGWLVANASDRGTSSTPTATAPLRITELGWFRREHGEIPAAWVKEPAIRSWSACGACHTRAAEGSFREGEIRIPGHGGWED